MLDQHIFIKNDISKTKRGHREFCPEGEAYGLKVRPVCVVCVRACVCAYVRVCVRVR